MSVVELHPEELFDKWLEGELTSAERERLQQHLEGCSVCRFEFGARLDFQSEALELSAKVPPPTLPLRPLAAPNERERPARVGSRRRFRLWLVGLCAALVTASGVVAAGLARREPWHPFARFFQPMVHSNNVSHPSERAAASKQKPGQAAAASPVPSASAAPAATPSEIPAASPVVPVAPRGIARAALSQTKSNAGPAPEVAAPPQVDAGAADDSGSTGASAAELFAEANQARRAKDFGRATQLYLQLQDRFPGAVEAELSRVTLALLQLDTGNADSALRGFEGYLAGPSRVLEAEAMVGRARALGRLGLREREISAWRDVLSKYPSTIYGRQASERLAALGQQ
jgi:TolA-binding protein